MQTKNPYRWWNLIAFIATIAVNYLSNALPLGGRNTREISDQFYIYMTPASYAFTIWSVIYVLLAGFIIYQLRSSTGSRDSVLDIGPWFIISSALNIAWLFLWHHLYIEWSVLVMLLLLASLFIIHRKTRILRPTIGEALLIKLPFSLYLGWICAASLVNIGTLIYKNEWSPFGLSQLGWSIALLCIGALLVIAISFPTRDWVLPLVFVWALIAIAVEHREEDVLMVTAFGLAAAIFLYAVYLFIFRRHRSS
ncbi:tryptophan-rich sensory protein [Paenibacillus sp. JSM ZJ436]|uniref:tryptophan-rich sensory protein n=1 Tax=Paenibacillus sp. JSM ZJ436 TaxID=3376190 RepID=UPI00379499DB